MSGVFETLHLSEDVLPCIPFSHMIARAELSKRIHAMRVTELHEDISDSDATTAALAGEKKPAAPSVPAHGRLSACTCTSARSGAPGVGFCGAPDPLQCANQGAPWAVWSGLRCYVTLILQCVISPSSSWILLHAVLGIGTHITLELGTVNSPLLGIVHIHTLFWLGGFPPVP